MLQYNPVLWMWSTFINPKENLKWLLNLLKGKEFTYHLL